VDQIIVVPNILSKEQCAQMIVDAGFDQYAERVAPFDYKDYNNLERRRMTEHHIVKLLTEKFSWKLDAAPCLWYPAGSSNAMHADNSINENGIIVKLTDWTHSVILFLNDNFDGGELVYPNQGLTIKPTIGTMVVAPAGIEFPHMVTETDSDRYVLVLRLI
jgi:hypothetical protein